MAEELDKAATGSVTAVYIVALENGDEYYAETVVSNLDPKRTFLKLFDEKDLEPAVVKLDISLIAGLHKNKRQQSLVRHIVQLCDSLGASIVAARDGAMTALADGVANTDWTTVLTAVPNAMTAAEIEEMVEEACGVSN